MQPAGYATFWKVKVCVPAYYFMWVAVEWLLWAHKDINHLLKRHCAYDKTIQTPSSSFSEYVWPPCPIPGPLPPTDKTWPSRSRGFMSKWCRVYAIKGWSLHESNSLEHLFQKNYVASRKFLLEGSYKKYWHMYTCTWSLKSSCSFIHANDAFTFFWISFFAQSIALNSWEIILLRGCFGIARPTSELSTLGTSSAT